MSLVEVDKDLSVCIRASTSFKINDVYVPALNCLKRYIIL